MVFRRLNLSIAVNLFFLLGTALLLLNAVMIRTDKHLFIKEETLKAETLFAEMEKRLTLSDLPEFPPKNKSGDPADSVPAYFFAGFPHADIIVSDLRNKEMRIFSNYPDIHPALRSLMQEAHASRSEIIRFSGITWGVFWKDKKFMLIASPLHCKNRQIMTAGLAVPLSPMYLRLRQTQGIVLTYIFITAIMLSLLGVYRISAIIGKPLNRLVKRAEEYREEDDVFFLGDTEGRGFSRLSKALNRMMYRISSGKEELRAMVRSLEQSNRDLQKAQNDIINAEKLASVGRLAAGIAHEIGNPIAIIMGYLELLKQQDILPEEKEEFISRTEKEINRVNTIIRQLLDFSRPSDGNAEEVQVHEIIREVADIFRYHPLMSNIELKLFLSAEKDHVKADPAQLRQIFLNLMINAADAIVSAAKKEAGELILRTSLEIFQEKYAGENHPQLCIEIRDNGSGISENDLGNVFEPFYTTKEPGKGTGLGLSVCYMIIETLGGKIRAESREHIGTSLIIHLPLFYT